MTFEKKFEGDNILPMAVHPGMFLTEHLDSIPIGRLQHVLGCSDEYFHGIMSRNPNYALNRIMCIRLAHFFETSFEFWENMQTQYDYAYLSAHEELVVEDVHKYGD